ncbi:SMI1/KNR4 family protein, partial [Niallia circulans]
MNIWKGGANDYTLDDLVQDDIILAEKHFNVKLPKSYIDLLKIKNGGTLQY